MPGKIRIITKQVQMEVKLNGSRTAGYIWEQLPINGLVNTSG